LDLKSTDVVGFLVILKVVYYSTERHHLMVYCANKPLPKGTNDKLAISEWIADLESFLVFYKVINYEQKF